MKKIILTMAAVSAIAVGAPAAAQYANSNVDVRIGQLQTRLQAGIQNRTITRVEADTLRGQLRELTQLERQYSRNGLTNSERNALQQRVQYLQTAMRNAERNGDYRNGQNACPPGLAKKNNGCVPPGQVGRVGSRYSYNYGTVPSRYGNQYRDSDRYYYRYDNAGRIYQVDRRNMNIVRVVTVR